MISLFLSALAAGLLATVHCLSMCGGLLMCLQQVRLEVSDNVLRIPTVRHVLCQALKYHLGRLCAYTCLGVGVGFVGQQQPWSGLESWLRVVLGLIMAAIGLCTLHYRRLPKVLHLPSACRVKLHERWQWWTKRFPGWSPLILGFAWGLLPCGMVYVMLAGALALANPGYSGLFMLAFGLGTLPGLLSMAVGGYYLQDWLQTWQFKYLMSIALLLGGVWFAVANWPSELSSHAHHQHVQVFLQHSSESDACVRTSSALYS